MAEQIKTEILIDINLEQDEGDFKKLADLKGAIQNLVAQRKALQQSVKEGHITQKEANSELVRTEALQKKLQSEYNKTQREITGLKNPLEEINNSLQKQTALLGGAIPGLDKLTGGAASAAQGIFGMVKASLAFIATPIGAIIAAVGLAIASLTAYFKGSEEGQNRFNKIVAVGSAILEQFQNVLEFVGEAIFNAFANPKQAVIDFANLVKNNIINRFEGFLELIPQLAKAVQLLFKGEFAEAGRVAFDAVAKVTTGIEDASGKIQGLIEETVKMVEVGIKAGERLADIQKQIDLEERALITERARIALEVSKLRNKAVEEEGDVKRKTIEEAIALETELSDKEVKLARLRLAFAKLAASTNGETKEALDEVAKATAAVTAAEQIRFDNTLKFKKQLESITEEEQKEQARIEAEQEKNNEEVRKRNEKERKELAEAEIQQEENNQKVREKNAKKAADKEVEIEKKKDELIGKLLQKVTGDRIDANKLYTSIFKKGAFAETLVNAKAGATAAYKAMAGIPIVGPVLGGIAAAAVYAYGLAQAAGINAIGFAKGGRALSGKRISHGDGTHVTRSNGDNLLATVRTGEVILNERQQAALGGANTFRRIGVPGFAAGGITGNETRLATQYAASQLDLNQLSYIINRVQTVLVLEDFEAKASEVSNVNRRATVVA